MNKVLIVDDEATITTQLEERLRRDGFDVSGIASSGREAVQMARSLKPDVILMDIVMPGDIDGIQAAEIIKKELDIPVIFLTAYGEDRFINRAKTTGPAGYIIKPYQENAVKAAVEIALYNKEVTKKAEESKRYWRSILEKMKEGIVLADAEGKVFFWNKGAEDICGYGAEEAVGKSIVFFMSESVRVKYEKDILTFVKTGRVEWNRGWVEIIGLKKDWSRFPLEMSLTPVQSGEDTVFVCVFRDISERKKRESQLQASVEEKELNIGKLHQRIKKSLKSIYDLKRLQFEFSTELENEPQKQKDKERFPSLTRLPEKIHQAEISQVINMKKYTENLVNRLFDVYEADRRRIEAVIAVDAEPLEIKTAMTCGLIIGELVSNVLKYSIPKQAKGKIGIFFHKEKESGLYVLIIEDNGQGISESPDFQPENIPGLEVVFDLAEQLKGKTEIKRNNGIKFIISFPPPAL